MVSSVVADCGRKAVVDLGKAARTLTLLFFANVWTTGHKGGTTIAKIRDEQLIAVEIAAWMAATGKSQRMQLFRPFNIDVFWLSAPTTTQSSPTHVYNLNFTLSFLVLLTSWNLWSM